MSCRSRYLLALMALTLLVIAPGAVSAANYEVYPDGKSGYTTIQEAVDASRDGDTVIINVGTYTGTGNRDVDLGGKGITIQSTDPTDPDVVAATVIDCQGTDKAPHRGFLLVGSTGATLQGLTIQNGLAEAGGAVYCENSAAVISDCRIIDNATLPGGPGGGIYAVSSALMVDSCQITGNMAGSGKDASFGQAGSGGDGGGIYAISTVVTMVGSTVTDNTAGDGGDSSVAVGRGGAGGGIYAESLLIVESTVSGNTSGSGGSGGEGGDAGQGGGIYADRATIAKCVIEGNATGRGGDSIMPDKTAAGSGGDGGGVYCTGTLEITGSLVVGNRCGSIGSGMVMAGMSAVGGGLWCADGVIDLCTIASNVANDETPAGGAAYVSGTSSLTNSIVWDNWPDQLLGPICETIAYCDIQDGKCSAKQGNLTVDPVFADPGYWADAADITQEAEASDPTALWVSGDYGLASSSPCIDAGDPEYADDASAVDLTGRARVVGKAIDMGAYETQELAPVYKFQSPVTGKYFFTADESEKDLLLTQPESWTLLGVAYQAYREPTEPGLMPVYRFWGPKLLSHFWTISESERDYLIDFLSDAWTYEGPVFYAYPEGSQPAGTKPVYRFWSATLGAHYYTIDESEKAQIIAEQSDVWVYETIAWYAYEADSSGPDDPVTEGTEYEFVAGSGAASFELELRAYLDDRQVQIDLPDVALASTSGTMKMLVDFDAMTTSLTEMAVVSGLTQHAAVITDADGTGAMLDMSLSIVGSFVSTTERGAFVVDSQTLGFTTATTSQGSNADEVFQITGAVVFENDKYEIDASLMATDFVGAGQGTFDDTNYPDSPNVSLDSPFEWSSQRQETLLFEAGLKGHTVRVYVASAYVQPNGTWLGKDQASGEPKSDK